MVSVRAVCGVWGVEQRGFGDAFSRRSNLGSGTCFD